MFTVQTKLKYLKQQPELVSSLKATPSIISYSTAFHTERVFVVNVLMRSPCLLFSCWNSKQKCGSKCDFTNFERLRTTPDRPILKGSELRTSSIRSSRCQKQAEQYNWFVVKDLDWNRETEAWSEIKEAEKRKQERLFKKEKKRLAIAQNKIWDESIDLFHSDFERNQR